MYGQDCGLDTRLQVDCLDGVHAEEMHAGKVACLQGYVKSTQGGSCTKVLCRGKPKACDVALAKKYSAGVSQRHARWQVQRSTL